MLPERLLLTSSLLLLSLCMWAQNPDPGVPHSLAEQRKKAVSDVEYDLTFTVPPSKEMAVEGEVTVSFYWDGSSDLALDFQAETGQLDVVAVVNGKRRKVCVKNEHILLPRKWLRKKQKNRVFLSFRSGDKALNRHDDYLYSLFVPDHARSVFPCFDQPDLKALFRLALNMPEGWTTMASVDDAPIPTYLFSFVAGRFEEQTAVRDGKILRALYRETDSLKVAQLPDIFDEVALSIRWMEDYTGIPCPFSRYGFVILPGFQFGGMEHPGAIQFADWEMFLPENPTPDERLVRLNLISHETAHLWFGDLVTMRWFNDVWTKEVFANFMASKVARERFPDIDHDINFIKDHYAAAMATDRTLGTHAIQQPLDNLNRAGLLYGNIIYHKAPLMMRKLEEQMGEDAMRRGLARYLADFAYSNATWDDLIDILEKETPMAGVGEFDRVWVKEKGMPVVNYETVGKELRVEQEDPFRRGLSWPQLLNMKVMERADHTSYVFPNYDGFGYGRFVMQPADMEAMMEELPELPDRQAYAAVMTLYENFLMKNIEVQSLFSAFAKRLGKERNPLIASTLVSRMGSLRTLSPKSEWGAQERMLLELAQSHPLTPVRQQAMRLLGSCATEQSVVNAMYGLWENQSDSLLNERDYMAMAYHLALVRPGEWREIIRRQRACIKNPDRLREFDFVSRACTPDADVQWTLFEGLSMAENRREEPYVNRLLALLNDPLREPLSNRYILPALELLEEIQRTGDIFFPSNWCNNLLGGHHSDEAASLVRQFLNTHPDYPEALRNKILQAADRLMNGF